MKIQTLLIITFALSFANAQEKAADPYKAGDTQAEEASETEGTPNISICYEDFSLPLAMAAALQQEQLTDAELYAKVRASLGKDAGKDIVRQETFVVARAPSGHKASVEHVTEIIYPTEYAPANAFDASAVTPAQPKPSPVCIPSAPAIPTAFETRNVGFTLEIEPILSEADKNVNLRFVPERVTLVGQSIAGQDISKTEMPIFEVQRMNTSSRLKMNVPFMIGTMNLPANSKQDPDSAKRVWFAFVTATLSK
jgi:hypothetical protein